MGTKYEGSAKHKVDVAIKDVYDNGYLNDRSFTFELMKEMTKGEVRVGTIQTILSRYIKAGALESRRSAGAYSHSIYMIKDISLIGRPLRQVRVTSNHGEVKLIKPSTDDILGTKINVEDLGEAVLKLLINMKNRIAVLEVELRDEKQKVLNEQKAFNEVLREKNKCIEGLQEKVELLRGKARTFTLGEVATVTQSSG